MTYVVENVWATARHVCEKRRSGDDRSFRDNRPAAKNRHVAALRNVVERQSSERREVGLRISLCATRGVARLCRFQIGTNRASVARAARGNRRWLSRFFRPHHASLNALCVQPRDELLSRKCVVEPIRQFGGILPVVGNENISGPVGQRIVTLFVASFGFLVPL